MKQDEKKAQKSKEYKYRIRKKKMNTEWKFERHTHYKQHEFAEKSK